MKSRILECRAAWRVTNFGRLERRRGRGFCAEWQRVLKEKRVSDFGWGRAGKVSNRTAVVELVLVRGCCDEGCLLRECNGVGRVNPLTKHFVPYNICMLLEVIERAYWILISQALLATLIIVQVSIPIAVIIFLGYAEIRKRKIGLPRYFLVFLFTALLFPVEEALIGAAAYDTHSAVANYASLLFFVLSIILTVVATVKEKGRCVRCQLRVCGLDLLGDARGADGDFALMRVLCGWVAVSGGRDVVSAAGGRVLRISFSIFIWQGHK